MNEPTRPLAASAAERPRPPRRRAGWGPDLGRVLRLLAPLLVVAACTTVDPPTVPVRLDLVGQVPLRAGEVELLRPQGASGITVVALRADLLVRAAVVGDRVHIAWVAPDAAAGPQVRLAFDAGAELEEDPVIVRATTLGDAAGPDLGPTVLAWRNSDALPSSGVSLSTPRWEHDGDDTPLLLASFADHPLGDLDGSGTLDVRDALQLLDLLRFGAWSDFGRYHGDLDADGASDVADLTRLLERLVDTTLPPVLDVRPAEIPFVALDPATDRDAIVLVANGGGGDLTGVDWRVPQGITWTQVGGIAGRSAALRLALPASARPGWRPGLLEVDLGAQTAEVRVGHMVVLVAGQSNAQGRGAPLDLGSYVPSAAVRMLGNDYRWRDAREPLDDGTGQLDSISYDNIARYSFGTRLGERLHAATGFRTYLIPAALGGTAILSWLPGADPLDRGTLFGSANYRSQVSAGLRPNPIAQDWPAEGGPVTAIAWYQGESDDTASERRNFVERTSTVFEAFQDELGAPVIYVQLAGHYLEQFHVQQHAIAELQRRMEAGVGDLATPDAFMVVAFDLPRSDRIHLSAFGLRLLAERIELAVREHVLGEEVDGTGPRLRAITHTGGTVVRVHTTRELAAEALDPALFAVFDGTPSGSVDDITTYGTNPIPIASVVRDPADARAVRITLASAPSEAPHVRYMGRPGLLPSLSNNDPSHPEVWEIVAPGVVRAADGGLPLPTFGPLAPFGVP